MPTVILPAAADPKVAEKRRTDAQLSVLALLDDLRHVVANMDAASWTEVANAVLDHHEPAINPELLPGDVAALQTACRDSLIAMRFANETGMWNAFRRVRDLDPTVERLEALRDA